MALRTYGDKPLSFQLEENGEYFYVGSEVSGKCKMFAATCRRSNRRRPIHSLDVIDGKKCASISFVGRQLFASISWIAVQKISGHVASYPVQ